MADISERTKVKVTIGSVISLIVTVSICTATVVNTANNLSTDAKALRKSISDMRAKCWQIDDQVQFASKLDKANQELSVPDPLPIMRERVSTEAKQKDFQ